MDPPALLCSCIGEDTYLLTTECATIPDTLCRLAHTLDGTSSAYCIRHHPHDVEVEWCIRVSELKRVAECLPMLLNGAKIEPDEKDPLLCAVQCPSWLVASVLRRTLQTRLHVVACSSIGVHQNTSAFDDWQVAHRCGQLTIVSDVIEDRGTVDVTGRTVRGKDIVFHSDASISKADEEAPIVVLAPGERLKADLYCTRGSALEHAKYHAVASTGYYPTMRLSAPPSREVEATLHEFSISPDLVITRTDGRVCRRERILEIAPGLEISLGPEVELRVESLGQMSAVCCVQRALAAIREQVVCLSDLVVSKSADRVASPAAFDARADASA